MRNFRPFRKKGSLNPQWSTVQPVSETGTQWRCAHFNDQTRFPMSADLRWVRAEQSHCGTT